MNQLPVAAWYGMNNEKAGGQMSDLFSKALGFEIDGQLVAGDVELETSIVGDDPEKLAGFKGFADITMEIDGDEFGASWLDQVAPFTWCAECGRDIFEPHEQTHSRLLPPLDLAGWPARMPYPYSARRVARRALAYVKTFWQRFSPHLSQRLKFDRDLPAAFHRAFYRANFSV